MNLLILAFIVLVVLFMVKSTRSARGKTASASERMAGAARLLSFDSSHDPPFPSHPHITKPAIYPRIAGVQRGRSVEVWVEYPNTEDPSVFYQVQFAVNDGAAFVVKNRSRLAGLRRTGSAMPEVTAGERAFDKVLRSQADDHLRLSQYLTPARQEVILSLVDQWNQVAVTNESLVVQSGKAVPKDPNDIVRSVGELVASAELLQSSPG